jgi:hypothetical protein
MRPRIHEKMVKLTNFKFISVIHQRLINSRIVNSYLSLLSARADLLRLALLRLALLKQKLDYIFLASAVFNGANNM